MTKKEILQNIGGISQTSKMPCSSWSLSAFWCNVGAKLNKIKGFKYTSSVVKDSNLKSNCDAYKNKGKCLDCRLCWDKSTTDITYKYH